MLDYDTCKKLKDCGFVMPRVKGFSRDNHACILEGGEFILPTLSELIESCGDEFQCLWHYSKEYWEAFSGPKDQPADYPSGKGDTPEEAIANLWLALQKEDKSVE